MDVVGFDLLNNGKDGFRYAWKCDNAQNYIESAAFVNRTKGVEESVCAYTTSVSSGCVLRARGEQCRFCYTGNLLPFERKLSFEEIAIQNVFMVMKDIQDSEMTGVRSKAREFAYMGQGEPGFSYDQVRLAIELTNRAMRKLNQVVFRHIVATSGIPSAIYAYKNDLQEFYTERVTLHLSMHALNNRSQIMPINDTYPIQESIYAMDDIVSLSGEKPCIGILLLNDFRPNGASFSYNNGFEQIKEMLSVLNPKKVRLSFCEYNSNESIGESRELDKEFAESVVRYAIQQGFDVKMFFSYGKKERTACGLLGGTKPTNMATNEMKELNAQAMEIVHECR